MQALIQPNVIMGLFAAFFWGGGDFSGGMGAKHAGGTVRAALRVILVSHSASFSILIAVALFHGNAFPEGFPLLYGLAAGITGGLSLVCFYIALARGAMGAAAAMSGLMAAAVPATFSMIVEGPPGTLHLAGFLIAGVAIWLIAAAPVSASKNGLSRPTRQTIFLAVIAGAGFGLYFILLKLAGTAGVAWPMATARMGSLSTSSVLLFLLPRNRKEVPARLSRVTILWSLSTAILDTSGNLLFISATRAGRLDIAAVLASLYPATTIILAGLILRERFSRRQGLGVAVAAIAVVMITL